MVYEERMAYCEIVNKRMEGDQKEVRLHRGTEEKNDIIGKKNVAKKNCKLECRIRRGLGINLSKNVGIVEVN